MCRFRFTVGILALAFTSVPGAATPPNIVVIMSDDQDYGSTLTRMLNVRSYMMAQGVTFPNNFAVNPVCCASRSTFLTGQYSHNDDVWTNDPDGPRGGGWISFQPHESNTLAVWLHNAGYRTSMIGKYLNGYSMNDPEIPPGWDDWRVLIEPYVYYYWGYKMNENGTLVSYGTDDPSYQTDVISNKAVAFIESMKNSSQPFFLEITGIAPHVGGSGRVPGNNSYPVPPPRWDGYYSGLPLPHPPSFNEADFSDKPQFMQDNVPLLDQAGIDSVTTSFRKRAETLRGVDDMVKAVLDELSSSGKLNSTYIMYVSDNGYFQGEHRLPQGKYLDYDESIRVPLIIRGPGVAANIVKTQFTSNVDLTATILDWAGARAGNPQDGQSLRPLLSNRNPIWRTAFLIEGADMLPFFGGGGLYGYYSGIRTADYVYVEHTKRDDGSPMGTELYNLGADPYEINSIQIVNGNTIDRRYQSALRTLKRELAALRTCVSTACFITSGQPTRIRTRSADSDTGPASKTKLNVDWTITGDPYENNYTEEERRVIYTKAHGYDLPKHNQQSTDDHIGPN